MKNYDMIAHIDIKELIEKDPPVGLLIFAFKKFGEVIKENQVPFALHHLYENSQYHKWLRENYPTMRMGLKIGNELFYEDKIKGVKYKCKLCLIECGYWRLIDDHGIFRGNKCSGLYFEPSQLLVYNSILYDLDGNIICKN